MKMKKVISLVLACGMMCGAFTGCGKQPSSSDGKVTISVGNWPNEDSNYYEVWAERVKKFNEIYPDIEIIGDEYQYDVSSFMPKAEGGTLPTVYLTHFTEAKKIIEGGYAADITAQYKEHGYFDKTNEFVLENISQDKSVYFIPASMYTLGIVANVNILREAGFVNEDGSLIAPNSFDELAQMAQTINQKTGKAGFLIPTTNNAGGWNFSVIGWNYGAKFMEKQGEKWVATFNSPEAEDALQFVKDLKWKYDVLPSNTIVDGTELYKLYATDNAGMLISAGDFPKNVYKYEMHPDKCGIMEIPAGPKRHVTLIGGMVYCINEDATKDQIDAAIRWLETESSYKISDSFKTTKESKIKQQLDRNQLVGIKSMSPWSEQAETLQFENSLIEKNANSNLNHVKLYNDFVANCTAEIQAEEPVCAQELYGVLDGCIQQVLIDENADCAELLEKANADFQKNYLNNITY